MVELKSRLQEKLKEIETDAFAVMGRKAQQKAIADDVGEIKVMMSELNTMIREHWKNDGH